MLHIVARPLCISAFLVIGVALLAAPTQDYPGQMTQAKTLIQNRGRAEAIPVIVQNDEREPPQRVQVVNFPAQPPDAIPLRVQVTNFPQQKVWEYRELTTPSGQSAINALNEAGKQGWELTGFSAPAPNGLLFILKRAR
jgi:hypothetical protein